MGWLLVASCGSPAADRGGAGGQAGSGNDAAPDGPLACATAPCPPADASVGETSPGVVALRLVVSSGRSFCSVIAPTCTLPTHIAIWTAAGQPVAATMPACSAVCSDACLPPVCPGAACVPQGTAFRGAGFPWDGAFYEPSTCGSGSACYRKRYVPAGRYVARMCATLGSVQEVDGGEPICVDVGATECVDVPFDLPGPTPVTGNL